MGAPNTGSGSRYLHWNAGAGRGQLMGIDHFIP